MSWQNWSRKINSRVEESPFKDVSSRATETVLLVSVICLLDFKWSKPVPKILIGNGNLLPSPVIRQSSSSESLPQMVKHLRIRLYSAILSSGQTGILSTLNPNTGHVHMTSSISFLHPLELILSMVQQLSQFLQVQEMAMVSCVMLLQLHSILNLVFLVLLRLPIMSCIVSLPARWVVLPMPISTPGIQSIVIIGACMLADKCTKLDII